MYVRYQEGENDGRLTYWNVFDILDPSLSVAYSIGYDGSIPWVFQ